jgi:hypothetical protein
LVQNIARHDIAGKPGRLEATRRLIRLGESTMHDARRARVAMNNSP